MTQRVLITGSRSWARADIEVIARALSDYMQVGDTLIHGDAIGVDTWAAIMWSPHGPVEAYPAEDFDSPLERNLHMIGLGADLCLAFALDWRSGSGHCARHARKAGIQTIDFGVDTRSKSRG